jgi:ribonuclease J
MTRRPHQARRSAEARRPAEGRRPHKATASGPALRLIPLGGMGEIGKNLYLYEYQDTIILVDCGLAFPDETTLGVDIIIPDISYLRARKSAVKAVLITHGHEDHVGALPHILPEFPGVPVYASTLARGLLANKLKEFKVTANPLRPLNPGDHLEVGSFTIEPFRVGHSIPDAMGYAIHSPVGTVIHTGDFKFDQTPADGKTADFALLAKFGAEGVLALVSDSTRAEVPGYTPSEQVVGHAFKGIISSAPGRVIISTFASNIARIQQILDAAGEFHRKVSVVGRSMEQNVKIARDLGYLKFPTPLLAKEEISRRTKEPLVIATTGAQGEPMAGLAKMANGEHRNVEIQNGDTVIVSASPIPGNEEAVGRTVDKLFKSGANVIYHSIAQVHVSGHASQEELKMMIALTKPKYFVPMHGEMRMQVAHGRLATQMGVPASGVFIIENGTPVEFAADGSARRGKPVVHGSRFVDGSSVGEISEIVLRDRRTLADDGIVVVIATIDARTGKLVGRPALVTRGFLHGDEDNKLVEEAITVAIKALHHKGERAVEPGLIKAQLSDSVSRFLGKETRRRPLVVPVVVEV